MCTDDAVEKHGTPDICIFRRRRTIDRTSLHGWLRFSFYAQIVNLVLKYILKYVDIFSPINRKLFKLN